LKCLERRELRSAISLEISLACLVVTSESDSKSLEEEERELAVEEEGKEKGREGGEGSVSSSVLPCLSTARFQRLHRYLEDSEDASQLTDDFSSSEVGSRRTDAAEDGETSFGELVFCFRERGEQELVGRELLEKIPDRTKETVSSRTFMLEIPGSSSVRE